jgi:hypothetical protein
MFYLLTPQSTVILEKLTMTDLVTNILPFITYKVSSVHASAEYNDFISIVKPNRRTNVSNLFYFGVTLYMFHTVFLSIIRSSRLYIQQQAFVKQILLSAC